MTPNTRKPRLLVVEDDPITADLISHSAIKQGYRPVVCPTSAEAEAIDWRDFSAALLDLQLPDGDGFDLLCRARKHHPELACFVLTSRDSAQSAVNALKAGAADYFTKPFEPAKVFSSIREVLAQPPAVPVAADHGSSEWKSAVMNDLHEAALKAAATPVPLLLLGEPGSGKRSLAAFIHAQSRRAGQPFASVDVDSLDEAALELELFGGEGRQATGRLNRKRGKIEMTHGGTLFIQDIDRLPAGLQGRLLDAMEMRGETGQGAWSDFRLIASAPKPLDENVSAGTFRQDLFYRLSTTTLALPPLRETEADIQTWSDRLLTEICIANGSRRPQFTRAAREVLADHPWPGNLDELRRSLDKALAISNGGVISGDDLRAALVGAPAAPPVEPSRLLGLSTIDDLERASLIAALEACNGNRRRAAQRLGVSLRTIYNMIARHALRPAIDPSVNP